MKKLLILGNGFDLAHGLFTKYSDFLDFCQFVFKFKENSLSTEDLRGNKYYSIMFLVNRKFKIKKLLTEYLEQLEQYKIKKTDIEPSNYAIDSIYDLINNNIWYIYLQQLYENNKIKSENWIDFESEISVIIEFLDRNCNDLALDTYDILSNFHNDIESIILEKIKIFEKVFSSIYRPQNVKYESMNIRKFRKKLNEKLKNFTEALEIYLSEFVSKQPIELYSQEINELKPNYIINFNYTNTYSSIYSYANSFHIHGYCRKDVSVGKNNMVLGINEYWSEHERDEHTNFTIFKKFAQRIQKRTGIEHKKIYDEMKSYNSLPTDEANKVYIFGHSLDVTDKDILKMFFEEDFEVTIFCRDEETEGEYIANVIKIIGEDELIKRVNQNPPMIIFKQQAPMISKASDTTFHPDGEEEEEPEDEFVTAK